VKLFALVMKYLFSYDTLSLIIEPNNLYPIILPPLVELLCPTLSAYFSYRGKEKKLINDNERRIMKFKNNYESARFQTSPSWREIQNRPLFIRP